MFLVKPAQDKSCVGMNFANWIKGDEMSTDLWFVLHIDLLYCTENCQMTSQQIVA